jgi:hypothetical protein
MGGGRGNRKLTKIWKSIKNANVKKQNKKKRWAGLNGWAFTEVFSTNVIKMTYKT